MDHDIKQITSDSLLSREVIKVAAHSVGVERVKTGFLTGSVNPRCRNLIDSFLCNQSFNCVPDSIKLSNTYDWWLLHIIRTREGL